MNSTTTTMPLQAHQQPHSAPTDQIAARFMRWLHDDQAGFMEIVAGEPFADRPEKIALVMSTRRWMYFDPDRADLVDQAASYIDQLATRYGNVYTGIRLYTRQARDENTRKEAYTKPSRVIFIDDAPAAPDLPYSASIRTSKDSRHGYYKADRHVTKSDTQRAAAALGGDASGVDLTQLVRVPGTFNTKNGERWQVEPEATKGRIYRLDDLRERWPAVEKADKGEITPINMPAMEKHLANIDSLLKCSRSLLIKADTQSGRILAGEMLTFNVKGKNDDSRSMNGYVLGNGHYIRGFMDDEIAAVMFHFYRRWGLEKQKGTEWCKGDIADCIARMHIEHPDVKQSPTRYRQRAKGETVVSTPAASRARSDRPTKYDPAMLFARYQAEPGLCELNRKSRAGELGISTATLDRLESELRTGDNPSIRIEAAGRGLAGRVILLGGVINIPADRVLSGQIEVLAQNTPIEAAESEQSADRSPVCIGGTHTPPDAPSAAALPADDFADLDMSEIERWVKEIQAVEDAKLAERTEPQLYWEKHEALVYHESRPVAPQPQSVYQKHNAAKEASKKRTRAAWDAIGDNPSELGRRLGKLRNRLKKYPQSRHALAWQIHELNSRIAALTPADERTAPQDGTSAAVCPPLTTYAADQTSLFSAPPIAGSSLGLVERLRNHKADREQYATA